jgi:hypothetical protein
MLSGPSISTLSDETLSYSSVEQFASGRLTILEVCEEAILARRETDVSGLSGYPRRSSERAGGSCEPSRSSSKSARRVS